jgi:hypothetical protein
MSAHSRLFESQVQSTCSSKPLSTTKEKLRNRCALIFCTYLRSSGNGTKGKLRKTRRQLCQVRRMQSSVFLFRGFWKLDESHLSIFSLPRDAMHHCTKVARWHNILLSCRIQVMYFHPFSLCQLSFTTHEVSRPVVCGYMY